MSSKTKEKSFKIETVKWSWAEPVQNKGVYRDDEYVRTKTKEEALEAIRFLMNRQPSRAGTYTITVLRDGEYFTYWRHSMPCLGGLVKYRDSHGERYFMNPYFPRDISVAYPEGDNVYIACYRSNAGVFDDPHNDFIFSPDSPWVSAFGSRDTVIFEQNHFVLTNMDTDPTVFYSLMRLAGFAYSGSASLYSSPGRQAAKTWKNPKAMILATKTTQADPRRLAGQKPIRISGGTWAQGFGYTRPYNESIFKTSLPTKYSDFGTLAGYPNAPYTNEYFVSEMKKVFNVDASKGLVPDPKTEAALVEAWDHFKKEADKLTDDAEKLVPG